MKTTILFWLPRAIGIAAILFMLLFSFDCFEGDKALLEKTTCFLIHNIPVFAIAALLVIFWKKDLVSGIIFICISVFMAVYFQGFGKNPGVLAVAAPFLLTGILFILNYLRTKNRLNLT